MTFEEMQRQAAEYVEKLQLIEAKFGKSDLTNWRGSDHFKTVDTRINLVAAGRSLSDAKRINGIHADKWTDEEYRSEKFALFHQNQPLAEELIAKYL